MEGRERARNTKEAREGKEHDAGDREGEEHDGGQSGRCLHRPSNI